MMEVFFLITNKADEIYGNLIRDIMKNGKWDKGQNVRPKWEDGTPAYTKSILNARMQFDENTVPILTQKRVGVKDPIKELLWIWQQKSNTVQDLRDMGCNVWNEWENEDGSIGKAYGWQLSNKYRKVRCSKDLLEMIESRFLSKKAKKAYKWCALKHLKDFTYLDQVDYLLYTLKTNPYSRRIKTTLWNVEDLDYMTLEPCLYETHWQVWDNKLHLTVNVRSNDMALGNPYNIYQYSVLHRMISQVVDIPLGTITFNIDNAHIYERHIEGLKKQINIHKMHSQPELKLNPDIKSFYDFTLDDINLIGYNHSGSIKFPIAI